MLALTMCATAQAVHTRTFVATKKPQVFVFHLKPTSHISTAFTEKGRDFLSGGNGCSGFARYGTIRAKENACGDALMMRFRSTAGPTRFLYRFWIWA